jgi:hypothetical protein
MNLKAQLTTYVDLNNMQKNWDLVVSINENKKFCVIFYINCQCRYIKQENVRKKLGDYQDYVLELMIIRFFIIKCLLESLENMCILTFININLIQLPSSDEQVDWAYI